jgi:hypothetical protein
MSEKDLWRNDERAIQSMEELEGILDRAREERQRAKKNENLSEEERKQRIETIKENERSEIAALFDRLGIISTEPKVRALQQLQGPVKPRKAA